MSLHPQTQQATERLQHALTSGQFQSDLQPIGQKLLEHLRRPTQITVMGPKCAGKSSLISMLLGSEDIELPQRVAISELIYGADARVTFEGAGTSGITHQSGALSQDDIPDGTVRVVQELPLSQLKGKSLVEINLPSRPDQQKIILDWAVETTDIVIWCTQNFDDREAVLWQSIPDRLKDHSLLALTKADRLQLQGALKVQSARFGEELAEEFLGMFPVATKQAIAARDGEAVTDASLWTNSGGAAFLDGLTRQITSGKMADLDQADMLLARAIGTQDFSGTAQAATPKSSANRPIGPTPTEPTSLTKDEAVKSALASLEGHIDNMGPTTENAAIVAQDTIGQTLHAVQGINAQLSQTEEPSAARLADAASECEQLVLLLQLENTDTAANDALTALLQLKKELAQEAYR